MDKYYLVPSASNSYLSHHGIMDQEWGVRHGPPYPLARTADGRLNARAQKKAKQRYGSIQGALERAKAQREQKRVEKKDLKWVKRNQNRLYKEAYKKSKKELRSYEKELAQFMDPVLKNGKVSKNYAIKYNQRMAELMNTAIGDVPAPSGRVVRFIAKRGEIGVHTALADPRDSLSGLKRGVYDSGRIAFKQESVHKAQWEDKRR